MDFFFASKILDKLNEILRSV